MSVTRIDGTAARPLDWPERRRTPSRSGANGSRRSGERPTAAEQMTPSATRQDTSASRLPLSRVLLFAACWALLVAGAMAVVSRQSAMASLGYRITAAQAQTAQLEHENMLLAAEVARLEDPERIYRIATEELGMVSRDRFEVTVVAQATPVVRQPGGQATVAALGAAVQERAASEGFWPELGRSLVGWLTGKPHAAAAKSPE